MKRILFSTSFFLGICVIRAGWLEPDKPTMARGKKVYDTYCRTCHQADGGGVPGLNPPLDKTPHVLGSKTKLIQVILKGMNTHEEIEGETYSNIMAPHKFLTDQQISDVLTYIRNSFGNGASVITPGDVKYVRAKTK